LPLLALTFEPLPKSRKRNRYNKKALPAVARRALNPKWWASREKTLNFLSLLLPWLCSEEPPVLYEKLQNFLL
jgi:hypothetical protein